MIPIDKNSSDKTLEIARGFEWARVEEVEWSGYASTKAHGLTLVENDRVFWIDADERITPGLHWEPVKFKLSTPPAPVYSIPGKAYFLGKWIRHSGRYPGRVQRLFEKSRVCFNQNTVHESLVFEGSESRLAHQPYHFTDPDIFYYYEKFNKYTSLVADDRITRGKTVSKAGIVPRAFFNFIKMYLIKPGFLDGLHDFVLAVFSSNYVFTKYTKLREKRK